MEHWLSPANTLELLPLSPGWWPALSPHPPTHPHKSPAPSPPEIPHLSGSTGITHVYYQQQSYLAVSPSMQQSPEEPLKHTGSPISTECPAIQFFFFFFIFIYLPAQCLCWGTQAFSSFSDRGHPLVAGHRLLFVLASLVVEHRL